MYCGIQSNLDKSTLTCEDSDNLVWSLEYNVNKYKKKLYICC